MILYTGCYTANIGSPAPNPTGKGIGRFEFNPDNGAFNQLDFTWQRSPSYLCISKDKKHLYAAEECKKTLLPEIFAYEIKSTGALSFLNSQKIDASHACHLSEVSQQIIVANYISGNALVYPKANDGRLESAKQVIQHNGSGIHPERQTGPHVHMVYPVNDQFIFLVDLGLDKALAYSTGQKPT